MSWIPLKPTAEDAAFQSEIQSREERSLFGKYRVSCSECSFDHIEQNHKAAESAVRRHKIFTFHSGVSMEAL